jgi:hypothetical protein
MLFKKEYIMSQKSAKHKKQHRKSQSFNNVENIYKPATLTF